MENEHFDPSIFGTSRSFKDWLHDETNPIVYCLLTLDGKEFIEKKQLSRRNYPKNKRPRQFCYFRSR
jgi:hypothetical protein